MGRAQGRAWVSSIYFNWTGLLLTFPFRFLGAIGGAIAGSLAEDYAKEKKHGGHSPGRQGGSSQGGFMDQASGFFKK